MSKFDAIILAGAPAGAEMSSDSEMSRAMVRIGDKTMLQWVVDALRASERVGRIISVGDVSGDGLDSIIQPGEDLVANIRRGVEALDTTDPILVVSSDIPLLTAEAVSDFLDRAGPLGVDLAYPIVPKAHCQARYPQLKRTYLKTADGVFTGGNLMLIKPSFITEHWQSIAEAYAARKHVTRLARMIGLGVLLQVIAGQVAPCLLRVSSLERAASRMLGASVAAVVSEYPEIGEDVDKPSDLEAVRAILGTRK
jgi:2-phospho-L-lactate guanylyltransferase (CobY/MobA/RfbA family)